MNPAILANKTRLDLLFAKVSGFTAMQDQAEWSKYLCVLTAGFIEESFRILLRTYTSKNASPKIVKFVDGEISFITNCKTERIIEVLTRFHPDWAATFQTEIDNKSPINTEIKDSLNGIVINRHKIAHGQHVGIGFVTVKNYYGYCVTAVEILETVIN